MIPQKLMFVLLLVLIIVGVLLVGMTRLVDSLQSATERIVPTLNIKSKNTLSIASIKSNSNDCSASISLTNGETFDFQFRDITNSCRRFYTEMSINGKYAAFVIEAAPSNVPDNHVIVFFTDIKDWARVYELGEFTVSSLSFDRDNNLLLRVFTGETYENKQINIPNIEANFSTIDPVTKKIQFSESF